MRKLILILLSIFFLQSSVLYCSNNSKIDGLIPQDEVAMCYTVKSNQDLSSTVPLGSQVSEFFTSMLKTESWPARWNCGEWSPFLGWFYILSDLLIWACYFTIPAILYYFLYKKEKGIPFRKVFIFFIGFILLCGLTHLIDAIIFWWPAYRLSALIRFGTSIVSIVTIFALVKVIPRALELKSPELLEKLVEDRTNDLIKLNIKYEEEIQERKNGEAEIKRLNKALSDFRKAITGSSIVSTTDKKGEINFVNDNFVKISGYQAHELIGQNHRIINSGHHGKDFWVKMWKTIANGKTWREEVKNRAKDGSYYWVDTFVMPFKDDDGRIYQYLSIRNDITERKQAENELKELNNTLELRVAEKTRDVNIYNAQLSKINQLFETVQSHAHMGVWEYNVENKKLYLSNEIYRILEIPENYDLHFSRFITFIEKEWRENLLEAMRSALQKGTNYDLELKIITAKKTEKWIRLIGIPEFIGDDAVLMKGLLQNIDNWKNIENKLRESQENLTMINEELSSFTYSVSHDLRAPIRYINGHAKILEEDFSEALGKDGGEILQVILNNTNKMGQLIDDLLDFSRLGRTTINDEICDMNKIVKTLVSEMALTEENTVVKVKIDKLISAKADHSLITQVWINLLSNAFKYTKLKKERRIEVGSKEWKNEFMYFVKDNGTGFDMEYSHKLFGVFQRLHRVEEFEGTGVGLAIVQKIVSRHNGKVWAEAEEGKGATFYFTLPKNTQGK